MKKTVGTKTITQTQEQQQQQPQQPQQDKQSTWDFKEFEFELEYGEQTHIFKQTLYRHDKNNKDIIQKHFNK